MHVLDGIAPSAAIAILDEDLVGRARDRQEQIGTAAGLRDDDVGRRDTGPELDPVVRIVVRVRIAFVDDVPAIAAIEDVCVGVTAAIKLVIALPAYQTVVA